MNPDEPFLLGDWISTDVGDAGELVAMELDRRRGRLLVYRCERTGELRRTPPGKAYWVPSPEQIAAGLAEINRARNGQPRECRRDREYVREPILDARRRRMSTVGYV